MRRVQREQNPRSGPHSGPNPVSSIALAAFLTIGCAGSSVDPRQISNSRAGAYESALEAVPGGLVAAWYDTRDGNGEIYLRSIDAQGGPAGPEIRLTESPEESYEPSLAAAGDAIAVAWYDKALDGTLTGYVGVWNLEGDRRWTAALPSHSRNPVICADEQAIVVSWIQKEADGSEAVWLGTWDHAGTPIGVPHQLGPAHRTTWNLNAALDADRVAWVVFDAVAGTQASELFLAQAGAGEPSLMRLTADDGFESKYPDIALRDGRVALTWFDAKDGNTEVYLFAGTPADMRSGLDTRARRVTTTAGESIGAYLAWNGERIGLAWSDETHGQHEVYFQPFDAAGNPLAEASRLTRNRTSSLIPAIEPWRDGFALAWTEYTPVGEGHGGRSEIAFVVVP